jgi:hypothetical protein
MSLEIIFISEDRAFGHWRPGESILRIANRAVVPRSWNMLSLAVSTKLSYLGTPQEPELVGIL